jgi:hypothetical protein
MPAGTDELVTRVPAGYLTVALDEVSGPELAARRARLLGALGSARPGQARWTVRWLVRWRWRR